MLLSFAIAGAICACAARRYAELATMMPAAGGAYTYGYVVLGEPAGWVIGWSLMLEYSLVVSTVAAGWSGYAAPLLAAVGVPAAVMKGPSLGGVVNLPAIGIIAVVAGTALVAIKIATLALFVFVTLPAFDAANLPRSCRTALRKRWGRTGWSAG